MKNKEIMIARRGKPIFAVRIDAAEEGRDASYVFVENGDIKFDSSWLSSITPFEVGNESHRLAKEIFTIGLQAAVKTKIFELKQLESILRDLDLADCLGNVLVDNTKLLIEVNNNINKKASEIIEATAATIKVDEVKEAVEEAIVDTVKPIAVKSNRKKSLKTKGEDDDTSA